MTTLKAILHPKKVILLSGGTLFIIICLNPTSDLVEVASAKSDVVFQQVIFPVEPNKVFIDEKRPELTNRKGFVFHQCNARTRVSFQTR